MLKFFTAFLLAVSLFGTAYAADKPKYEPTWKSLDTRPTPAWFADGKFGIFIHWGVYSVPSYAPKGEYSEWYWNHLVTEQTNGKGGPTLDFHNKVYGKDFGYKQFGPMFKAEMFDPDEWADFFARSGAKYIVLTSKHHDGYCLWPSKESPGWNSMDVGPKRDLLGDLTTAVRKRDIKMGFYYSLYEWYNPVYRKDVNKYVAEHLIPQFKDVVNRYKPSIIFADGEWDHPSATWKTPELLAWLFNESNAPDDVVINDRWGSDTRSSHGGYFTTEYGKYAPKAMDIEHPWEECRGMAGSFGYCRRETVDEYKTGDELVQLLVQTVSRGGNLLLDIGPTGDGRIPVIMQERLVQIGDWLKTNGEAIYGTKACKTVSEGDSIFYTQKDGAVYAILIKKPTGAIILKTPDVSDNSVVTLLGGKGELRYRRVQSGLSIQNPVIQNDSAAYVFKITNAK